MDEEQMMNKAKEETKSNLRDKKTKTKKEKDDEETRRAKKLREIFQNPHNNELREYIIDQIVQWRMVDLKNDKDIQVKRAVFNELKGIFFFLDADHKEVEAKKEEDSFE